MSNVTSSIRRKRRIVTKRLQAETAAGFDALLPSILDKGYKGEL